MPKTEAEKAAKKAAKAAATTTADAFPGQVHDADDGGIVVGAPSASGDLFSAKDWDGALILFTGQRMDLNVTTKYGSEAEVPVGRVVVLDPANPTTPRQVFPSTSVFGKALLTGLRDAAQSRAHTAGKISKATFKNGDGWVIEEDKTATKAAVAYLKSLNPLNA